MSDFEIVKIAWIAVGINVLIIFYPLLFLPFKKIWKIVNLKRETVKACMSDGSMEREINLNYSPAFISLLIDRNTEPHKDLLADLLNLIYKKIVNVNLKNNHVNLSVNYENVKKSKISKEEKLILDHIEKISRGYKSKFNFKDFEQAVRDQFIEEGFDKEDKLKKYLIALPKLIMYGIRNIAVFALMVTLIWAVSFTLVGVFTNFSKISSNEFLIMLFWYAIMAASVVVIIKILKWLWKRLGNIIKPPMVLSEKGKEEYKKILKFKYYLEEYTLIKDKALNYMALLDWYIPYAIAVNTNKGYKKDIEIVMKELNIEKIFLDVFEYELRKEYIL